MGGFGWLWKMFASFWFWLDKSLYSLIGYTYDLLMQISRVSIFSQKTLLEVTGRIQMLLGIFMLFKVGFSLIMYVVNPDDFSDQSKGVGKLVQNTVISLILLVIVPYIFNMAYRLQAMILEDNTMARLIMGNKKGAQYDILNAGERMQFEVMLPFFQPNIGESGLEACSVLKDGDDFNPSCYKALKKMADDDDKTAVENYKLGVEQGSFGLTFRLATINAEIKDSDDKFLFDYKWPLTTIAGVVVCLLLINFCIDIALRSVKLSFLQLISPVPIISYMDPKSGNDGMFSKWYKMCISTYVSLFVRLLALFLGIFVITNLSSLVDNVNGSKVTNPVVNIFIIIGVLFFVKQLPTILKDLGFNMDGDAKFNLNPFKKMEDGMMFGKTAAKLPYVAGGAAMGAGIGALGTLTGAGLGKSLSGTVSGIMDALQGKKLADIHKNQVAANARMREALRTSGGARGFFGRRREQIAGALGTGGGMAAIEREKKRIQDAIDDEKNAKEAIEGRIAPIKQNIADHKRYADSIKALEERAKSEIEAGNGGTIGMEYLSRKARYERLKNQGAAASYAGLTGDAAVAQALHDANEYLNKTGMQQYLTEASQHIGNFAGNDADKTFDNLRATATQAGTTVGVTLANNGGDMHSQMGAQRGEIGNLERSIYDDEQQMATHDSNIKTYNEQMQSITEREARTKANTSALGKN